MGHNTQMYGADPNACMPTQIMRVVGSVNMRLPQWYRDSERTVRVLSCRTDDTGNAQRHSFEYLSMKILPYTREEVAAYRASKHLDSKQFHSYADNVKARAEYFASIQKGPLSEVRPEFRTMIANDDASRLWWARLGAMRKIVAIQGGIIDGQGRNAWCWIACNAMGWVTNKAILRFDTAILINEIIPSYSASEIQRSAASVTSRVNAGERFYSMKNETFCKFLNITPEVLKDNLAKVQKPNAGIMGFKQIRDLPFKEYRVETKLRQSLSAGRTNDIKNERSEQGRASARIMKASGKTQMEIAIQLKVAQSTVSKWLKT